MRNFCKLTSILAVAATTVAAQAETEFQGTFGYKSDHIRRAQVIGNDGAYYGNLNFSIPKHLINKNTNKYLSLKEIYNTKIANFYNDYEYTKEDIVIKENTPLEIKCAVIDMHDFIENKINLQEKLQIKYKNYLSEDHYSFGSSSYISPSFLVRNKKRLFKNEN